MAQSVDTESDAGPPPSDGLTLVGETKGFLQRWQRLMLGPAVLEPEQVVALRQEARALEARARAADMSGLAHHLQSCEHCFWNGEIDRAKLVLCLRNVSEVAWQWRHDLRRRSELMSVERQGHVPEEQLTIDPHLLLTPPSIELFESTPPPAPEPDPSPEWGGESLAAWRRPSLLSRVWGSRREPADAAAESPSDHYPLPSARAATDADAASDREPSSAPEAGVEVEEADDDVQEVEHDASLAGTGDATLHGSPWRVPRRSRPLLSAALGVLGIVGVGTLVWVFGGTREPLSASSSARNVAHEAVAPRLPREAIERLVSAAHGLGGLESPELADWLDEEGAELARTGGACTPGALGCPLISTARGLSVAEPAAAGRGSWLAGLEPTGLGIEDDPLARQVFEFHTQNPVGRETFQELLFRCAAYREPVRVALLRYGLPLELLALPMAASGCVPDAESSDGVRGLWQLSAAAAKAYHLRVKAQLVDERLDPAKSTEAAVRLVEDLHRKLSSWELAIAAHRIGPLALASRMHDAGDDVDFISLAKTGMLPDDTVKFVRKVQAFALILANLDKFRFQAVSVRAPEATATLEVPPGTRLGLVARAAASSTTKIRELNPDLLGDRVPEWPGEKFLLRVPKDAELRAREVLKELIASSDHSDECVPHAFDWGRQRFTTAMASRCEHATASNR